MSEATPTCQIHEKYPWIKCQRDALDGDPYGRCLLHSWDQNKDHDAIFTNAVRQQLNAEDYDFSGVLFPGIADFSRQKFIKKANFSRATFQGAADFSEATFSEKADFNGATFNEKSNFMEATFLRAASFSGANFSGEANFSMTTFSDWAIFSDATFSDTATFPVVIFSGGADFSRADFSGGANFRKCTFSNMAEFFGATFSWAAFSAVTITATGLLFWRFINNLPDEKNRRQPVQANFNFLQQEPGGRVLFQDLSLAQAQFQDTDLRRMEFNRVTWASWWWRTAVYNEIRLHHKRWANIAYLLYGWMGKRDRPIKPSFASFASVERIYRQLKINYEEVRDFKRVGDFHYGEMEMHRRGSFWRQWVPFSWYNLYRLFNGYGERPLRAFGLLIFFLAVLTGLLAWAGLEILDPKFSASFGNPFFYLLQKVTLQRPTWAVPRGFWGNLVAGLSVLLIPGQAALFLLALRNRLGRRR